MSRAPGKRCRTNSSFEQLGEELLHRLPRPPVRPFIAGGTFRVVIASVPVGEGVDRPAVGDQLPVNPRLAPPEAEPDFIR